MEQPKIPQPQIKLGLVVVVAILLGLSFYAGLSYGKSLIPSQFLIDDVVNKNLGQPEDVDFSLFWDTWRKIEEKFVGRDEINKQELVFGAISGMVKALDDPYTVFLEPQESKIFKEDVSGSFEGIGAEIGLRNDILTIISPLEGSPAQQAGLRAGDRVLEIDGESTEGVTLSEAVQRIRGPRGSSVVLNIFRDDAKPKDFTIVRNTIKIPVLEWEAKEDNIIHIQLFSFSEEAPRAFREALLEILSGPTDKIILDLRNNPGGFLEVSQELMGWFVQPGEIIVIEDFGDERRNREYRAIGNGVLSNFKVVVLINGGSASAAEIMAGALRDIRGVQLVGEKSFGKGSIQQLENLSGGASLKVTIARWLTPSGISISKEGLKPDVEVEITEEDIEEERDPQLERAIEVIKSL